ncbi:hypothetical protein [Shewanella sp. KCT]|uniref:hypothetical protein n=1 Tax=Shewanella sp. KCT TaxID=2569535 RepID=UPI001182C922|nr:hypothetical protein [Shewanella sp. KCT]
MTLFEWEVGELALFLISGLGAEVGVEVVFVGGELVSDFGAHFVNCQSSVCLHSCLHGGVEGRIFMVINRLPVWCCTWKH